MGADVVRAASPRHAWPPSNRAAGRPLRGMVTQSPRLGAISLLRARLALGGLDTACFHLAESCPVGPGFELACIAVLG
eukprot:11160370-Alexandrium_andersonii.AAC.1